MTPAIAYDLGHDFIRLLVRDGSDWTMAHEVATDDPDLGGALERLAAAARAHAGDPPAAEVIIPGTQILYVSIDAPGPDPGSRETQIAAALDGMTPYAVDELVFDWRPEGARARVAALARETLNEARDFVEAQGFGPLVFTARPGPDDFPARPIFGRHEAVAQPEAAPDSPGPAPGAMPEFSTRRDHGSEALSQRIDRIEARIDLASVQKAKPAIAGVTDAGLPADPLDDTAESGRPDPGPAADPDISAAALPDADPSPDPAASTLAPALNDAGDRLDPEIRSSLSEDIAAGTVRPETAGKVLDAAIAARARAINPRPVQVAAAGVALVGLIAVAAWLLPGRSGERPPVAADLAAPDLSLPQSLATAETALAPARSEGAGASRLQRRAPQIADATAADAALRDATDIASPQVPVVANIAIVPADRRGETGPARFVAPTQGSIHDLYIASIDPDIRPADAFALFDADTANTDPSPTILTSPPAAGTVFDLDPRGLVRATPEGALTPEGAIVFLGRPPVTPPATRPQFAATATAEADILAALPRQRPRSRPAGLVERNERAVFAGRTRAEMAALRPRPRPAAPARIAEAEADAAPTAQAVAASATPNPRPADMIQIVATARATAPVIDVPTAAAGTRTATPTPAAPQVAVAPAAPSLPSNASVARQATIENAIQLKRINLIGVYGASSDRRALVRLQSGRYVKVKVGDRVDGGRVAAIGDRELRYVKGGRNIVLNVPGT